MITKLSVCGETVMFMQCLCILLKVHEKFMKVYAKLEKFMKQTLFMIWQPWSDFFIYRIAGNFERCKFSNYSNWKTFFEILNIGKINMLNGRGQPRPYFLITKWLFFVTSSVIVPVPSFLIPRDLCQLP